MIDAFYNFLLCYATHLCCFRRTFPAVCHGALKASWLVGKLCLIGTLSCVFPCCQTCFSRVLISQLFTNKKAARNGVSGVGLFRFAFPSPSLAVAHRRPKVRLSVGVEPASPRLLILDLKPTKKTAQRWFSLLVSSVGLALPPLRSLAIAHRRACARLSLVVEPASAFSNSPKSPIKKPP